IDEDAVESLPCPFHTIDLRPEITDLEILFVNRKSVERVRSFRHVEEKAIAVEMHDARGPGSLRGHAQATRIGEGIERGFTAQVIQRPQAKIARVQVKTRVTIQQEVDGIPHAMLTYPTIGGLANDKSPQFIAICLAIAAFHDYRLGPRQLNLKESRRF